MKLTLWMIPMRRSRPSIALMRQGKRAGPQPITPLRLTVRVVEGLILEQPAILRMLSVTNASEEAISPGSVGWVRHRMVSQRDNHLGSHPTGMHHRDRPGPKKTASPLGQMGSMGLDC